MLRSNAWVGIIFLAPMRKLLEMFFRRGHIRSLRSTSSLHIVSVGALSQRDIEIIEYPAYFEMRPIHEQLWNSRRSSPTLQTGDFEPTIHVNPAAGVGLLDMLVEYETTEGIPRKQRDLSDFTLVNGVKQVVKAIEDVDPASENVRENRKVRYLSLVKRMGPKKDFYDVPKVRKGGMGPIVSASAVGNIATRCLLDRRA